MTTTPIPPTAAALRAVLSGHRFYSPPAAVAAFLASPVAAAPGVGSGVWNDMLWVRDFTAPAPDSAAELARAAAGLAVAAHTAGDVYLDLSRPAAEWVKVLRSGHRRVAYGPDLLWGCPKVSLEGGVGADRVADFVAAWRTSVFTTFPAVVCADVPFLVDGTRRRVVLRAVTNPEPGPVPAPWAPPLADAAAVAAADIAARMGGRVVLVRAAADGCHAQVEVGARQVRVGFSVHPGSYQVDTAPAAGGPDAGAGDGFVAAIGDSRLVHVPSGIVCTPVPVC